MKKTKKGVRGVSNFKNVVMY